MIHELFFDHLRAIEYKIPLDIVVHNITNTLETIMHQVLRCWLSVKVCRVSSSRGQSDIRRSEKLGISIEMGEYGARPHPATAATSTVSTRTVETYDIAQV